MAICGKYNRDYVAYLKNAVNFLVAYIYVIKFLGMFSYVHSCMQMRLLKRLRVQ